MPASGDVGGHESEISARRAVTPRADAVKAIGARDGSRRISPELSATRHADEREITRRIETRWSDDAHGAVRPSTSPATSARAPVRSRPVDGSNARSATRWRTRRRRHRLAGEGLPHLRRR